MKCKSIRNGGTDHQEESVLVPPEHPYRLQRHVCQGRSSLVAQISDSMVRQMVGSKYSQDFRSCANFHGHQLSGVGNEFTTGIFYLPNISEIYVVPSDANVRVDRLLDYSHWLGPTAHNNLMGKNDI